GAYRAGEGAQGAGLRAQDRRVPGKSATHPCWKGGQEGAPGALLGGPRPPGQLAVPAPVAAGSGKKRCSGGPSQAARLSGEAEASGSTLTTYRSIARPMS